MKIILCIALGGSLGALLRYLLSNILIVGPAGILCCNVIGSFLMGFTVGLLSLKYNISDEIYKFITIGLLGSFTTFSSYALNIHDMLNHNLIIIPVVYTLLTLLLTILALYFGIYVSKNLVS
tara:strand:- start:101 stop:466 length:366 start_codon:yes stop_codon:yes gene_type:complete